MKRIEIDPINGRRIFGLLHEHEIWFLEMQGPGLKDGSRFPWWRTFARLEEAQYEAYHLGPMTDAVENWP